MISIELARKLKDAGLNWEPKKGDWFIDLDFPENANLNREDNPCLSREYFAWLPSLSDLLAEVERRGWAWSINMIEEEMVPYHVSADSKYEFNLAPKETPYILEFSTLSTFPEEVAGQALL